MATSMIPIPSKTWTLISEVTVNFQIPEQTGAWAVEASALPTDLSIRKKITPSKIYTFTKIDGNLYMYSDSTIEVAIEPVS